MSKNRSRTKDTEYDQEKAASLAAPPEPGQFFLHGTSPLPQNQLSSLLREDAELRHSLFSACFIHVNNVLGSYPSPFPPTSPAPPSTFPYHLLY